MEDAKGGKSVPAAALPVTGRDLGTGASATTVGASAATAGDCTAPAGGGASTSLKRVKQKDSRSSLSLFEGAAVACRIPPTTVHCIAIILCAA